MDIWAISIFKPTLLLPELADFVFIPDEAQLCSLQIFNIGPSKFTNRCFTFMVFSLIIKFIANRSVGSARERTLIQDEKNLIIKMHLVYTPAILLELADNLLIKFTMTDMSFSVTFEVWVLHRLSSIIIHNSTNKFKINSLTYSLLFPTLNKNTQRPVISLLCWSSFLHYCL